MNKFEKIEDAELESQQIDEMADLMKQMLQKRYGDSGEFRRGVHPKSHGCYRAKFQVSNELPEPLRVGLFSQLGAEFESIIRLSNADALVQPDLKDGQNGSRGFAIKIKNVPGEVIYSDSGESTQDFLLINTPQFAFANILDYLELQRILLDSSDGATANDFFAPLELHPSGPPEDPAEKVKWFRAAKSAQVIKMINDRPVANPFEVAYFGGAPFLFGPDRAMHISIHPKYAPDQQAPTSARDNYLREAAQATMSKTDDVVFDVKVQVRSPNEDDLFIEDATKHWPDGTEDPSENGPPVGTQKTYERHTVATLTIPAPQTEPLDCEKVFFTPWHCLKDHQPIGSINRLRRAVYVASAEKRNAIPRDSH